ncbi:MAG: flagellar protein FlaG [Syntrophobacter sp.]
MSVNTGEILPIVTSSPWAPTEQSRKDTPVIPVVSRVEGGATKKVGEDKNKSEQRESPVQSRDQASQEHMAAKVQEFLDEATNVQLKFKVNSDAGETVVQVLDKDSGEVIRQIPPESLFEVHSKLEELRGVLFDGKA